MEYEYIKCMTELLLGEACKEKVIAIRFEALQFTHAVAQGYLKKGFLPELVEAFFVQKIGFISDITYRKDLEKYREPSTPIYNGGRLVPSGNPYYVEQEELFHWSEASLQGPLIDAGYKRYRELFEKYLLELGLQFAV